MFRYERDGYVLERAAPLTEAEVAACVAAMKAEDDAEAAELARADDRPIEIRRAGAALDDKFAEG